MNNNDFFDFYGKHDISPVEQDISDFELHLKRREKLYRQLGMPRLLFEGKDVLEVGPGSGYNTLAFFEWNVKHVDLVEANETGIRDMKRLFHEREVESTLYSVFEKRIEDYEQPKQYDIVIAESFLQYLKNQQEVIDILIEKAKSGGVIVITCSDDTCFYIEQIKRVIAQALSYKINDYSDKVKYLADLFRPQLKKLRGVSRSAESWVQDQLLNPVAVNGEGLSLIEAMHMFHDCEVLSSAPRIFTDYSWYKDVWYDYKKDYEEQYVHKGANLVMANMFPEWTIDRSVDELISKQKRLAMEFEKTYDMGIISKLCEGNMTIQEKLKGKDKRLDSVLAQITEALGDISNNGIEQFQFETYTDFFSAFGRTQQYMSFIKG